MIIFVQMFFFVQFFLENSILSVFTSMQTRLSQNNKYRHIYPDTSCECGHYYIGYYINKKVLQQQKYQLDFVDSVNLISD